MLNVTDVPDSSKLRRLEDVHGSAGSDYPLAKYIPEVWRAIKNGHRIVMVDAATGAGKGVLLPDVMHESLNRKILCTTPDTIGVENMQKHTKCKSRYRLGGSRAGGADPRESRIVFATKDLAMQWYASDGVKCFRRYGGILLDELHQAESDAHYALVFEVALRTAEYRYFPIVGCSATFSAEIVSRLTALGAAWVRCPERPFPLQRYLVEVATFESVYPTISHMVVALCNKGFSCLVFLPGKAEIASLQQSIIKGGLPKHWAMPLHADMELDELYRVMEKADHPKALLSTSLAETSITLPEVDYVLDCCLKRSISEDYDMLECHDTPAPKSNRCQREGRAARVKDGCAAQVVVEGQACS